MKAKTEFVVGVGIKNNGEPIHPAFGTTLMKLTEKAVLKEYDGVTITHGRGMWRDPEQRDDPFEERVMIVTVYHTPKTYHAARKRAEAVAEELREIWDQACVMVSVTRVGELWFQ